jgi:hypothetical protein
LTSSGLPWADSGRPDWTPRHRRLRMVCLRLYSLLGIAGYAGLDGGLWAMGRSRGGAARRNAIRLRRPKTQLGMQAAGRGGSCPAQRDQATSTAGGPTGTRAVSGLWERRAGARVKPEQVPQGATGQGLRRSRGPEEQVQFRGPITPTSDMAELTVSSLIVVSPHTSSIDELSGRTTGPLRYIRPDTAHAI